ncbi:MAG: paraquat-inducible protein A [Thermodesulfobacteriota bacterium]
MQSARAAMVAALASLALLLPAYLLPFAELTVFGERKVYTLWASMGKLATGGNLFLAAMIFLFSVLFPLAKLGVLLAGLSGRILSPKLAATLLRAVKHLGKWSMTDVFIVAFVLWLASQNSFAAGSARAGIFLFAASTMFSMAAAVLAPEPGSAAARVPFPAGMPMQADDYRNDKNGGNKEPEGQRPIHEARPGPGAPRSRAAVALLVLGVCCLAAGGALLALSPGPSVTRITIAKRSGLLEMPPLLDRVRDYYLVIRTEERDGGAGELLTQAYDDVPIGNGLSFEIAEIPLRRIREITIMDKNLLLPDKPLDRVTVSGVRIEGQSYGVALSGPPERTKWLAMALAGAGALLILLSLLLPAIRKMKAR